VRRRWQALSTQDRIALIGLLVAVLGVVPGYLALRGTGGADPPVASPSGVSGSDRRQALQLLARYNWTTTHIMWALPGQLSPEDRRLAEQPFLGPDQDSRIQRLEALLARQDGVKIGFVNTAGGIKEDSELRLIITGQHDSPVLITRMRARVLQRHPPLSETLFFGPPQGEGEDIQIGFDLDSPDPVARALGDQGQLGEPYFATKHVTVERDEHVVFGIKAFADRCYCEWEIVIDTIVDGQDQTFTVKDGSRPFRTTAFTHTYEIIYELNFSEGRFVRVRPGSRREYLQGEVFLNKQ
jgi:hypothetical protein